MHLVSLHVEADYFSLELQSKLKHISNLQQLPFLASSHRFVTQFLTIQYKKYNIYFS